MSEDRTVGSYAVVMDNVRNLLALARTNHETRPFVGPDMEDWSQRCERFLEELPEVLSDMEAWPAHPDCSSVMDTVDYTLDTLDDVEDDVRVLFSKASALTARIEGNIHAHSPRNDVFLALDIPIKGQVTATSMAAAIGRMAYNHATHGRPFPGEFRYRDVGFCEKCSYLATSYAGHEWGPVRVWGHRKTQCTPAHLTLTLEAVNEIHSLRDEGRRDLSRFHPVEVEE